MIVLECCPVGGGYTDKMTCGAFRGSARAYKLDLAALGPAVADPNGGTPGWPFTQDELKRIFAMGRVDGLVTRSHDPYGKKIEPCPMGLDCTDPCNPRLYMLDAAEGDTFEGECWILLHGC